MDYTQAFFSDLTETARASAHAIVPWVVGLIRPASVIDVGCGTGVWLDEFRKLGVTDITGIEGPWIQGMALEIPASVVRLHDLSQPHEITVDGTRSLAVCLEVAEHLAPERATDLVSFLVRLAPCILFSAAIPDQGGIGHANEQWPSYWAALFESQGYRRFDCVRGRFWEIENVAPWYAQNTFFFVKNTRLTLYPGLLAAEQEYSLKGKHVVHPRQYLRKLKELENPSTYSIRKFLRVFPRLVVNAVRRRLTHQ